MGDYTPQKSTDVITYPCPYLKFISLIKSAPRHALLYRLNYTNPGYGLSLVDTLWNAGPYRQPLEQEGNPMT